MQLARRSPGSMRAFFELAPVTIAGLESDWDWSALKSNAAQGAGTHVITIIPNDTNSFFAALTLTTKGELRLRLRQSLDEGADVQARCESAPWQENGQQLIKWTCRHHRLSGRGGTIRAGIPFARSPTSA